MRYRSAAVIELMDTDDEDGPVSSHHHHHDNNNHRTDSTHTVDDDDDNDDGGANPRELPVSIEITIEEATDPDSDLEHVTVALESPSVVLPPSPPTAAVEMTDAPDATATTDEWVCVEDERP